MKLVIFTPTWHRADGSLAIHPDCEASIKAQRVLGGVEWMVGTENPYPIGDHQNTLHQYQVGRERFLQTDAAALLMVEHDNVLPDPDAAQRLLDTLADVVYGVYMFRHGSAVINAYQYEGDRNLGQSLSLYSGAVAKARQRNVVRVSGCGFGCTLIRRPIVARIPFRGEADAWAPDVPFACDALRSGVLSAARFDVAVGHYHEGILLDPFAYRGPMIKVIAQQTVNVLVDGEVLKMVAGQTYTMPTATATELARANYVQLHAPEVVGYETASVAPSEHAVIPQGKRKRAG